VHDLASPISRQVSRGTDVPVRIFLIPFFNPSRNVSSLIDAPLFLNECRFRRSNRSIATLRSRRLIPDGGSRFQEFPIAISAVNVFSPRSAAGCFFKRFSLPAAPASATLRRRFSNDVAIRVLKGQFFISTGMISVFEKSCPLNRSGSPVAFASS
jgi:hypothetical protein